MKKTQLKGNPFMKSTKSSVILVLITCFVIFDILLYSKIITHKMPVPTHQPTDAQTSSEPLDESTPSVETPSAASLGYHTLHASPSDAAAGPLILVNDRHSFVFDNRPVNVPEEVAVSVRYNKTGSYSVTDINVSLNVTTIQAFNRLMDEFKASYPNAAVILTEGVRTFEQQQEMLDMKIAQYGEDQTIAAKPGYSEHHSGYAFDISTYENNVMATFTGDGDYAWIYENAWKYGFVLRYPEGKEDVTGISHETWHFRYVGVPHAEYMKQNGLTLEEYIEQLALYPLESGGLSLTDSATGDAYTVYSVPVDAEHTALSVPGDKTYTLSGDNAGHVIVTVRA